MKKINRIIVSAVLVSKDKKVLLGKVKEGGVYPDCWHIPGGGVDEGEAKLEALVREIKEEVGIDISDFDKSLISDSDSGTAIKNDKKSGKKVEVHMSFNTYLINLPVFALEVSVTLDDDIEHYKKIVVSLGETKKLMNQEFLNKPWDGSL